MKAFCLRVLFYFVSIHIFLLLVYCYFYRPGSFETSLIISIIKCIYQLPHKKHSAPSLSPKMAAAKITVKHQNEL